MLFSSSQGNGEIMVKGNKYSVKRWISSGDLMLRMMTIFITNNYNFLRVDLKCSQHIQWKVTKWSNGYAS